MCTLFNIEKTRTTPYHPESDGMVERMNQSLQDMLAKYVSDHQHDWDVRLCFVMMAYRSSVHSSTQYIPHYLLFGHEVRLPVDVMYGREPHQPEAASEYVRNLRSTLDKVHEKRDKGLEILVPSCSCNKDRADQEVTFAVARTTRGGKENQ